MTLRIIAGAHKGRTLKAPKGPSTRPTQGMLREAVFNICQNEISGTRFLDLFAGSGAMALEALSRGAAHATLVEQNRNALASIRENIATLHLESQTTVIPLDASRAIALLIKQKAKFDMVYFDPPYEQTQNANRKLQNESLLVSLDLLIPLLAPNATIFVEERFDPKRPHMPAKIAQLQHQNTRRFGIALLSIYLFS